MAGKDEESWQGRVSKFSPKNISLRSSVRQIEVHIVPEIRYRPGPNIIMGANAQVALEKFARYFDVEARLVPVTKESNYCLDPKKAMEYVDENTIGVFVIMGSTYTGHYEPVGTFLSPLTLLNRSNDFFYHTSRSKKCPTSSMPTRPKQEFQSLYTSMVLLEHSMRPSPRPN